MKILFITGSLNHSPNANVKIVLRLAEAVMKKGSICHILSSKQSGIMPAAQFSRFQMHTFAHPRKVDHDEHIQQHFSTVNRSCCGLLKKFLILLSHPVRAARTYVKGVFISQVSIVQLYVKQLIKVMRKNTFDAIIAVYYPPYILQAIAKTDFGNTPLFLYQLDPWALTEVPDISYSERLAQEISAFQKASHIFTTPILLEQYNTLPDFQRHLSKMTAVEFPLILPPSSEGIAENPVTLDSAYCNLLYAGSMSDEYRDPIFFLNIFVEMLRNGFQTRIYFIGNQPTKNMLSFMETYDHSVFYIPRQPPNVIADMMSRADVLVNIGNSMTNQMPSKLLDYVSTGKPIVSTRKPSDRLSSAFLDRYPLGLVLDETLKIEVAASRLEQFCRENSGHTIPFEQVREVYLNCTPDYVANTIMTIITSSIGG